MQKFTGASARPSRWRPAAGLACGCPRPRSHGSFSHPYLLMLASTKDVSDSIGLLPSAAFVRRAATCSSAGCQVRLVWASRRLGERGARPARGIRAGALIVSLRGKLRGGLLLGGAMARDRTCKSDIDDMQDRAAPRSMLLPSSSVAMCSIKSIACPSLSALPFRMPSTRGSQVIAPRSSGFRLRPCLVCPKCRSLFDQGSGNATPCQVSCNEVVGGTGFAWSWQPLFRKRFAMGGSRA